MRFPLRYLVGLIAALVVALGLAMGTAVPSQTEIEVDLGPHWSCAAEDELSPCSVTDGNEQVVNLNDECVHIDELVAP